MLAARKTAARRGRLPGHQTCASSRAGACLGDSSASGRREGVLLEVAPLPTLRRRARRRGFLGFGCPPVLGLGLAGEHREAAGPPVEAGADCARYLRAPWLRAAGIHASGSAGRLRLRCSVVLAEVSSDGCSAVGWRILDFRGQGQEWDGEAVAVASLMGHQPSRAHFSVSLSLSPF
jgi:hypothetical protein